MWGTRVLLLFPQIILVPFLLRSIGDSGYGVYALLWPLLVSIDQLGTSLQQGVVKYSAAFVAQKRIEDVNRIVSSSFIYSMIIAGTLFCAILTISVILVHDGRMQSSLVVVAIAVLLLVPFTPYVAVIQSQQRYYVGALCETISKYLAILGVIVWFRFVGSSVQSALTIMAGMLVVSRLVQVPIAYRLIPGLRNHPGASNKESLKQIATFGGISVVIGLCLMGNSTGVRWLMGVLISPTFVAHFAILLTPSLLLSQVVSPMTTIVMPVASAYDASGKSTILQDMLIRGTRYTTILVLAGVILSIFCMPSLLTLWVGHEYSFLAPYALALFLCTAFMQSTATIHQMLKGVGYIGVAALASAIGLVLVPIPAVLGLYYCWREPYVAVCAGLGLGYGILGILHLVLGVRAFGVSPMELLRRAYGEPLAAAIVVLVVAYLWTWYRGFPSGIEVFAVALVSLMLYSLACFLLVATRQEREQIKDVLRSLQRQIAVLRTSRSHRGERTG